MATETREARKMFEFIRSAFWGLFSSHKGEIDSETMEYYGEKTRNSLYIAYSRSCKGGRKDFKKLEDFKRGFNRPVPGIGCKE
jgi:hypothetical protein